MAQVASQSFQLSILSLELDLVAKSLSDAKDMAQNRLGFAMYSAKAVAIAVSQAAAMPENSPERVAAADVVTALLDGAKDAVDVAALRGAASRAGASFDALLAALPHVRLL